MSESHTKRISSNAPCNIVVRRLNLKKNGCTHVHVILSKYLLRWNVLWMEFHLIATNLQAKVVKKKHGNKIFNARTYNQYRLNTVRLMLAITQWMNNVILSRQVDCSANQSYNYPETKKHRKKKKKKGRRTENTLYIILLAIPLVGRIGLAPLLSIKEYFVNLRPDCSWNCLFTLKEKNQINYP